MQVDCFNKKVAAPNPLDAAPSNKAPRMNGAKMLHSWEREFNIVRTISHL
jgi:hypothetical protein